MAKNKSQFNKGLYGAVVVPFWGCTIWVIVMLLGQDPMNTGALAAAVGLILTSMIVSSLPLLLVGRLEKQIQKLSDEILEPHKMLAEQKRLQSFLLDIGLSLASSLTKEKIIRLIINNIVSLFECEVGFLLLYDDKSDRYYYEAGFRMDRTMLRAPSFSVMEDPLIARAVKEKEMVIVENVTTLDCPLPFTRQHAAAKLSRASSLVVAPLIVEERVLGIFELFCTPETAAFIQGNMMICSIAVTQAAIALGSAIQSGYAILDRKTMLYNHEYFMIRLREEISRCRRYKQTMSMMFLDIDHFKKINDTYGHQAGDAVLKSLANILRDNTRISDIPARYGGEEFAIILPGTTSRGMDATSAEGEKVATGGAYEIAEKLRLTIQNYKFVFENQTIPVTMSIGIGWWDPMQNESIAESDLIEMADQNLYKAKKNGRNQVCV